MPTVISTMTYRPVIDAEPSEEMLDASSSTVQPLSEADTRQLGLVDDPEKHAVLEGRRVRRVAADLPVVLIAEQRALARLQLDLQAVELGLVGVVAHRLIGAVEEVDARIAEVKKGRGMGGTDARKRSKAALWRGPRWKRGPAFGSACRIASGSASW